MVETKHSYSVSQKRSPSELLSARKASERKAKETTAYMNRTINPNTATQSREIPVHGQGVRVRGVRDRGVTVRG